MDHIPKCQIWNYKTSRKETQGENHCDFWVSQNVLVANTKSIINFKKLINKSLSKPKTCVIQKTLLREGKDKLQ